MKKTIRLSALLLCLALLLPCLAAPASAEGETVLYSQLTPSSVSSARAVWPANTTQGWMRSCQVLGMGTFWQMDYYNNRNASGGLPEGETMCIELAADIDPAGYAEVALSLQYALCPTDGDVIMDIPGRFELYTSSDGGASWSAEHATMFAHKLLSIGTTSNDRSAQIYQLSTTDIVPLLGRQTHIDRIRIRPYGDSPIHYGATRIQKIEVIGYAQPRPAPAVSGSDPGSVPVPEDTLREVVVQRMYQMLDVEWTTDTELVTYNSNGYASENATQHYHPGRLYKGPAYARPTHTTWEMLRSAIDGEGNYTGPTALDRAWGMDCIHIVSAALTTVSNARHDMWTHIMYQPGLSLLGGVTNADRNNSSSRQIVAENDMQTVLRGYAATRPGDFVLHYYPDDAGTVYHIRLVTLEPEVVYETDGVTIDAENSKLYLTETAGTIIYYWQKPDGSVVTVSGNTLRTTYGSETEDPAAYEAVHPEDKFLYGTSCRRDKVYTFRQLYEANYVAMTLEEYARGEVNGVTVEAELLRGAEDPVRDGVALRLASNWRIAAAEASLLDARTGRTLWRETGCPPAETFQAVLQSDQLDAALPLLPPGSYTMTLDVTSGPMTQVNGELPVTRVLEHTFTVGMPGDLTGDGKVNAKDVVLLQRAVAGGYGVTPDAASADLTGDGKVNAKDVVLLQRFVAGGYGVTL